MSEFKYVVYAYAREQDDEYGKAGTYYYIGKGTPTRPYKCHGRNVKCPSNKQKNIHILCKNLQEKTAYDLEKFLISHYGRVNCKNGGGGILLNRTNGGEGVRGYLITEEQRDKIRKRFKGENHPMYGKHLSEETKNKIRKANSGVNSYWYGRKHSEESKQKSRESKLGEKNPLFGKKMPEEQKEKLKSRMEGEGNHMYGKTMSIQSRQKMSESRSGEKHYMHGKHHSEETKRKIGEAQRGEKGNMYGKHHSDDTKRKMSISRSGEKNHLFGKHHKEETKRKISETLSKPNNPSRIPRDWYHPDHGVVRGVPICDLIKMFPDQDLRSDGLSNVANSKISNHRGWRSLNVESERGKVG
jgi:hypothetical protein